VPQILILAKDIREANDYARFVGLPRFTYRAVSRASAIRGIRNAEVHKLSSFNRRLDRHAILMALRNARTLKVIEVDLEELYARGFRAKVDPRGELTEEQLEEAYAFNEWHTEVSPHLEPIGWEPSDDLAETLASSTAQPIEPTPGREVLEAFAAVVGGMQLTEADVADLAGEQEPSGEATGAPEPSEDAAPDEAPRRRRTRCKTCRQLHFADQGCSPADFFMEPEPEVRPISPTEFFGGN
jgi:hypothetical protein